MKVMTIQLAKWRKVKPPMVLVDASIKSGNSALAPTWGLLTEYKSGLVGDVEYEQRFKSIIKTRWNTSDEFRTTNERWLYNPWTGIPRTENAVLLDPFGLGFKPWNK